MITEGCFNKLHWKDLSWKDFQLEWKRCKLEGDVRKWYTKLTGKKIKAANTEET